MHVTVYAECIHVLTEYVKYLSIRKHSYFLWENLGGSEWSRLVTASVRSDIPLLWRRLIVVAPTRQWLRRWQSVQCSTNSQWGAAWGQLCHALQSCKLVPAWDPRHGSRPGSSPGCLAATGRVQWTLESHVAVAGLVILTSKISEFAGE